MSVGDTMTGRHAEASPASVGSLSTLAHLLGAQQRLLVERVAAANAPGNLEGLFAFHVLHGESDFPLVWDVNPATPAWLTANRDRLGHMPSLAALGYGLWHFRPSAPPAAFTRLADGLAKLNEAGFSVGSAANDARAKAFANFWGWAMKSREIFS